VYQYGTIMANFPELFSFPFYYINLIGLWVDWCHNLHLVGLVCDKVKFSTGGDSVIHKWLTDGVMKKCDF
jgi:hypothetical protein